jgi:hypothetical protein
MGFMLLDLWLFVLLDHWLSVLLDHWLSVLLDLWLFVLLDLRLFVLLDHWFSVWCFVDLYFPGKYVYFEGSCKCLKLVQVVHAKI